MQEENLKAKARKRIQTLEFKRDFENLLILHNTKLGKYKERGLIEEYQQFPVTTWKDYCWQTERTYWAFLQDYVNLKVKYGFAEVNEFYRIMLSQIYPCKINGKYLIEIIYPNKKDYDLVITLENAKTIGVSLQPLLELVKNFSTNDSMYDVATKNFGNRNDNRITFLKKMIQKLPKIYNWSEQVYKTLDPERGEWLISWSALYICLEKELESRVLGNVSLENLSKLYLACLRELIKNASDSLNSLEITQETEQETELGDVNIIIRRYLKDITGHWSHRTHFFILLKILGMLKNDEIKNMDGIRNLHEKIGNMRHWLGAGRDFLGGLRLQNTILACHENKITQLSAQDMEYIELIAGYLYDPKSLGVKFENDEKVADLEQELEKIKQTNAKKAGKTVSEFDVQDNKPKYVTDLEKKIGELKYKRHYEPGYIKIESQTYTASYLVPYCIVYVLKAKKICCKNGNVSSSNNKVNRKLGTLFKDVFRGKELSESVKAEEFLNKIVDKLPV